MSARVTVDTSRSKEVMAVGSYGYGFGGRTITVDLSVSFDVADAPVAKEELDAAVERARAELGLFIKP